MDKKTFWIGVLTITGTFLLIANTYTVRRAEAFSIKDRDYQLVTATATQGKQSLYIADNRTGKVAIFTWDPTSRKIVPRAVQDISTIFVGPKGR